MGLGVLNPRKSSAENIEQVPGTEILWKPENGEMPSASSSASTKDIVLIPYPTTHPDDPLNWPLWKKVNADDKLLP